MINIGDFTSLMTSIFLNLSAIAIARNHPTRSLAVSLIDLKGDIKIIQDGYLSLPKKQAGLEPIDLPNTIMSDSETPST